MTRRIRIVGDGTCHGTRVLLPDGSVMPGVVRVVWELDARVGRARAMVELRDVQVYAHATLEGGIDEAG